MTEPRRLIGAWDDQVSPETTTLLIDMLVRAVADLGLCAERFGHTMVWVCNHAADPPVGSDARTWRLNPGLRQAVQLRVCSDGCFGWFWVWHVPGSMPEYEYIAPASEVDKVAARLAHVLAVRPEVVA